MDEAMIAARLQRKIAHDSDGAATLGDFAVLGDGHAGLTFGFTVRDAADGAAGAAPRKERRYVLKLAPPGITRRGNTDVYRQAPLLRALHGAGLPVPDVPFASATEDELGTPYIVMECLPGRSFLVWEPQDGFDLAPANIDRIWRSAAAVLAKLHGFAWRTALPNWEAPRALADELAYWPPILAKAREEKWLRLGRRLGDALSRHPPDPGPVGLFHGDYQPGNVMYDATPDGLTVTGVIDWELSGIGAQALDLGWLAMMADRRCWHEGWQPHSTLGPEELLEEYVAAGGTRMRDLGWFQALACYRLGSISCLNVRLHRTGRREDPIWERFAPSIEVMFERGLELCAAPAR